MSKPTLTSLEESLRQLGMSHAAQRLSDLLTLAAARQLGHEEFLGHLLGQELDGREAIRIEKARRRASFPFVRTIEDFDFANQTDRRVTSLGGSLEREFVEHGRCVVLSGKAQSGKTHLAVAIGDRQLRHGFEVRFVTAGALIAELVAADQKGRMYKAVASWAEPDLLIIDDFAGIAYGKEASERLFEVIHERHVKRRSMIVTSSKDLSAWPQTIGDATLAQGLLDRLLERGRHIQLDGGKARDLLDDESGIPIGMSRPASQVGYEEIVISQQGPDALPPPPTVPPPPAPERADSVFVEPERRLVRYTPAQLAVARAENEYVAKKQSEIPTIPPSEVPTKLLSPEEVVVSLPEHERDIGREVEGYVVTRMLGAGGLGIVYVGMDPETRGEVAIKILKRTQARNKDIRNRFLLEAQIPRLVKHANVIQIFACGEMADARPYYVMELLDGQNLRDRMQVSTPLTVHDALRVFIDMADALRVVHKRGIVHRDLKPENVFLTFYASGQVVAKVMDFGIARVPLKIAGVDIESAPLLTVGTPRYMSPERMLGEEGDARTDLYALGLVMYEVFTHGEWPWDVDMNDVVAQREAHLDKRPRPSNRLQKIGPRLQKLVMRCLEKDPARRPQSADEVKVELVALAGELPRRFAYSSDGGGGGGDVLSRLRRFIPRA